MSSITDFLKKIGLLRVTKGGFQDTEYKNQSDTKTEDNQTTTTEENQEPKQ